MDRTENAWRIEQDGFTISPHMETCFTLANGYVGVRGTFEEMYPNEGAGTYVAGVFDQAEAQVTELVNLPFFFGLHIYVNKVKIDLERCEVLEFHRSLDMKRALLYKRMVVKDERGQVTKVEGTRFVSWRNRHLAGMEYLVTPINYDGWITVESLTDGSVLNHAQDPAEKVKHFTVTDIRPLKQIGIYHECATRDQGVRVAIASALTAEKEGENRVMRRRSRSFGEKAVESVDLKASRGEALVLRKYIAIYTTREVEGGQLFNQTEAALAVFFDRGMEWALAEHVEAVERRWEDADIRIAGDEEAEMALRFNLFHLMSIANPEDERVSLGAKGLHGEGYKGHVFWDTEIFMLPFFIYTDPLAARRLILYRYHLLDAARENARRNGYKGAQFPWESADNGGEETPRWGFDYKGNPVRIWTGDIEYHITADIAYAVWEYTRATGDLEFFHRYGMELFLETARFWSSRAEYNAAKDRYEVNQVIGPDEFHEHVNNNFYTNYLAKWNLEKALALLKELEEKEPALYRRIVSKLCFTEKERTLWRRVAEKLYIPRSAKGLLMEQFEGYFQLEDRLITDYDENNMPVWPERVDITRLNGYTLVKQADVVMLLHLMGDRFDHETKRANFQYYEKRTMHKSSLSPSMYSLMGLVVGDHRRAYEYFMRTATVDLADNQGNTGEGFHAASAGGTWQAAVFGFGGMFIHEDGNIGFAPAWLPPHWEVMAYRIHWRGRILEIRVTQEEVTVRMVNEAEGVPVYLYGEKHFVQKDRSIAHPVSFRSPRPDAKN